jgi:CheY-like chemotaxis protein
VDQQSHALIIEDEAIIALEVECLLSDLGYRSFAHASSPSEALEQALCRKPDLITADYRINGGTGVEAVAGIVQACGPVPVIYITGNSADVRGEGRLVLDKPITPGALADACRSAAA